MFSVQTTGCLKFLREKLVHTLPDMLVNSAEIEASELWVVAFKSDVTMYVSCVTAKETKKICSLKAKG